MSGTSRASLMSTTTSEHLWSAPDTPPSRSSEHETTTVRLRTYECLLSMFTVLVGLAIHLG